MTKFSDSSHNILSTYFDVLLTPRTGTQNSYLAGQRKTIFAKGGLDTTLYQKNDDGDFIGHKFLIQTITGNNFKFQYQSQVSVHSEAIALEMGKELYFRKDSLFHDWLKNNAASYENAVNTNKTFIYFGKIYPITGETTNYNIIFDGMKDYVMNALPEHNRTDKLTDLMEIFFDNVYHDIYNMTKTLWSFFDAKEVNINHIDYLATRAGIETDKDKIETELGLREFVDQLPWWLKRKGTYTSYLTIYKILLGNTKNKLNFYEKWTEWCLRELRDGAIEIFSSDFEDHHLVERYGQIPTGGAGPEYYNNFNPDKYPTYTDIAPTASCVELSKSCNRLRNFQDFSGSDDGGNLTTQLPSLIQVDGFNPSVGDKLYLTASPSLSGRNYFRHCLTASVDASAQPSGGVFVWAVSNHKDKTISEHETDGENFLGLSYEVLGTPSGSTTGRRFKVWEHYNGVLHAKESSGSYNADQDYYISIEKLPSGSGTLPLGVGGAPSGTELNVSIFVAPQRRDQDLSETLTLRLHENAGYNSLYPLNYRSSPNGADWAGDIQSLYEGYQQTRSIAPTGNLILSPHYKVEIDLSSEPLGEDYIIDEDTIDELLRYWDYLKPASKFPHYHELISPLAKIDELSEYLSLYPKVYTAVCDTRFVGEEAVSTSAAAEPVSAAHSPSGDFYVRTAVHKQPIALLTWNFNHSLNHRNLITQIFDKDDIAIYPASIWHETLNRTRINWTPARRGRAFAAGMKPYNTAHLQTTEVTAWNVTHNMGSSGVSGVCCQVYEGDYTTDIIPDNIQVIDPDTLKFTFAEAVSGRAFIRDDDYYHEQSTASTNWLIQHNQNTRGVIVQFRDHNGYWIYPREIYIDNYNEISAQFSEAVSGTASLIFFRRDFTESDVASAIGGRNLGYWKIGNGGSDDFNPLLHNDLSSTTASGNIESWAQTSPAISGSYVTSFHVPVGNEYTINEMGIFDSNNVMQFYTRCSTLHKPSRFQLDVRYRIRKNPQAEE